LRAVGVKLAAAFRQKLNKVLGLAGISRVLPININPVEPQVLNKLYTRARELGTAGSSRCRLGEVSRVRPPPNGEDCLEFAVALLEKVELLDAAVDVVTRIVPGVGRVVLLEVRVRVAQVDLASFRANIRKGIQDVGQVRSRYILRLVVTAINAPVDKVGNGLLSRHDVGSWNVSCRE